MSEPNVPLVREGDTVLVRAKVVDAHWRDKRLYEVEIVTQDGPKRLYIRDKYLSEPDQA